MRGGAKMPSSNVVIYARYSSDNQREESIEGQLRECRAYAERNDMKIIGSYIDRALSAKTDARPQFQKMIQDSNAHRFQFVLVWKLDRFSRNRFDSAYYKRALSKNNVKVISATEPISNTPEGIMLESMLEGMAEYYSAELAEKVTRGHTDNALKCKFNGGSVPLGYRINEERHYEPDPVMSPIVKEVFERYAGGESIKELCADMNARGIRTGYGRKFVKSSFQNMLRNRRYLGEYRYRDIVTENAFPALIDQETFDKVRARMKANKKAPARSKSDEDFILTGKLVCGNCGALMVGDSGTSHTGATYYYYKCGHRKRKEGERCHMKAFRKELIESFVVKRALGYVLQDSVIAMLADALVENQKRENTHLPALQEELEKVNKKIDNIAAAIEEGIVTQTTKERLTALEAQREELQISIFEEETSHPKLTKEYVVQWLKSFKQRDLRDPKVQRQVIECFVNTVYVFENKLIVNLNLRDGDKPIALSKGNGSDIETFGSPKNAPQLRLGSFFGASVRGIEQDGRPQAAKNNPADCFLVRGRFTFYAPHSSSNRIRCNDGFCFCFYGGYGAIETIAGFADEAVVDFDAHNRFTVNYLFLVDDDFLNQRVNQFLVQLRNIGIWGDQIGEILYALRFGGCFCKQRLNFCGAGFQFFCFRFILGR